MPVNVYQNVLELLHTCLVAKKCQISFHLLKSSKNSQLHYQQLLLANLAMCLLKPGNVPVQTWQCACSNQAMCLLKPGNVPAQTRHCACSNLAMCLFKPGNVPVQTWQCACSNALMSDHDKKNFHKSKPTMPYIQKCN